MIQCKYNVNSHQQTANSSVALGNFLEFKIYIFFICRWLNLWVQNPRIWRVDCTRKLFSCVRLSARLLCPWDSPGKNTGVGCHSLFQGIFLTQGSNPGLPHCRQILYHKSHQGSPYCLNTIPSLKQVTHTTHQSERLPDSPVAAAFHPHSAVF